MSAVAGMPPVPEPPAQSVATDQDPFGPPAFQVADAAWEWLTTPITAAAAESAIKAWPRRFWVWLWVALRREWRTTSGRVICIAAPPDGTDVKTRFLRDPWCKRLKLRKNRRKYMPCPAQSQSVWKKI